MQVTGKQIASARSLAGITSAELAEHAGLSRDTIMKIEAGHVQPRNGTIADIARVFSERGVEFIENNGVRQKSNSIEVYEGVERFQDFSNFLYEHLKENGGDVCCSIYDDMLSAKYRKNPELHRKRMKELVDRSGVTFRILATKGDFEPHGYAQFRWQPQQHATPTGFYAFGDCLALMSFVNPNSPYVVVIHSSPLAEGYRQGFNNAWQRA